jgi:hypothetical protein
MTLSMKFKDWVFKKMNIYVRKKTHLPKQKY